MIYILPLVYMIYLLINTISRNKMRKYWLHKNSPYLIFLYFMTLSLSCKEEEISESIVDDKYTIYYSINNKTAKERLESIMYNLDAPSILLKDLRLYISQILTYPNGRAITISKTLII